MKVHRCIRFIHDSQKFTPNLVQELALPYVVVLRVELDYLGLPQPREEVRVCPAPPRRLRHLVHGQPQPGQVLTIALGD